MIPSEDFHRMILNQEGVKHSFNSRNKTKITSENPISEFGLNSGPGKKIFIFDIPEKFNQTVVNVSYNENFLNNKNIKYVCHHVYKDGKLIFIINNQGENNILLNVRIEGFPESYFKLTNDIKKHKSNF